MRIQSNRSGVQGEKFEGEVELGCHKEYSSFLDALGEVGEFPFSVLGGTTPPSRTDPNLRSELDVI
jgi:hypothetical protein